MSTKTHNRTDLDVAVETWQGGRYPPATLDTRAKLREVLHAVNEHREHGRHHDCYEDHDTGNPCRQVIAERDAAYVELATIARMQGRAAAVARKFLEAAGCSDQLD